MNKKVIAMMLSAVLALGSIGTFPAMAADTTTQENEQIENESEKAVGALAEEATGEEIEEAAGEETEEAAAEESTATEEEEVEVTEDKVDANTSESDCEEEDVEKKTPESIPENGEEKPDKHILQENDRSDAASTEVLMETNKEDEEDDKKSIDSENTTDAPIENEDKTKKLIAKTANGLTNIEVIGGQYYSYIYATTYGNLSFNVNSDVYCSVIQGNTFSNAGYYYYQLNLYPKDGGKNTIIEVYDNDSGQNIDILVVHSSYQEAAAQTICAGKNIEVSFETIDEISKDDVIIGSIGSDTSISCTFNSLVSEGIVSHGISIPYTYRYTVDITLYTLGQYTVNLMNNSTYTTLERIPVTVVEHNYDNGVITSDATCQKKAVLTKTCSICGDTISEEIGGYADHAWNDNYTIDKPSTCTEEGSESVHCSVCDAINERTVRLIPKKEHNYGDWAVTKVATCTLEGSKERICVDCGNKATETIPAIGHIWNEEYTVDKKASCTEEGTESIHCSVCDVIKEGTSRAIAKTGHQYGGWITTKEATCTEDGSKAKACADCGNMITETIPATGHIWNEEYTVDKEASCTEEGFESIHCSICGEIDKKTIRSIPKKEHIYGDWRVTKKATCTEDGIKEKACVDCGNTVTETIPATGHIWNEEYTVDKEASCTEEGAESIHCSACDVIKEGTSRAIAKTGHQYGGWITTKEATCTEDGSKAKACADCENTITEIIPATGHTWDEDYTVDKEATYTEEGSESIHCSICGEIKEDTSRPIARLLKPISLLAVTGIVDKTYTGDAITQEIVIHDGAEKLKHGNDYTVSYRNNVNAGIATVNITGVGYYTGEISKTFTIAKAIQNFNVKAGASNIEIGKATKVTASGAKETTKYTFTSSNTKVATVNTAGTVTGKAAGTVTITISTTETDNYLASSKTLKITVNKVLKKPGNCHFTKWNNSRYTGCRISWNKVDGAEGYQTLLSWTDGSHSSATIVKSNVLYRDCTVHPQHVSQMKVRAFYTLNGQRKYGPWSNVEYITPSPAKLTTKNASSGSNLKMNISWNIIYGCNGYNVFITTNPNGKWYWNQSTIEKATATSASIDKCGGAKLKKNTRYYVRIVTRRKRNGVFCTVPMPANNTYIGSFVIK